MSLIRIRAGTIYDPANGIDGEVHDLWISEGKIVAAPSDPSARPDRDLDARGLCIMPGGIDMHCHIAGPKVNIARKMIPEDKRKSPKVLRTDLTRSGTLGSVPSTFATGYKYAAMGYTAAFDAAIPPLAAKHIHEEFLDTPMLDKGFFVLMGNNHFIMQELQEGNEERVRNYVAWLLRATKGYAAKLVNPGGVENWKSGKLKTTSLDEVVEHFNVTPRQILTGVAKSVTDLGLPHATHIHCNNLGLPGNWTTTLETMQALDGFRGHLTHIQFHSYGGDPDNQQTFCSRVPELAEYINRHPNLSVDVGQVMFGNTTSMTGDGPLGYFLHKVTGNKWFSSDTEVESGCGIVPIEYKNKSLVHALQWAIGLEWYLLTEDPWRIGMSTDHPNGGSFLAYPQIIALLMDKERRKEVLDQAPVGLRERCTLPDLTREYSLYEIAIITRAAPARMLGLTNKGHLGIGADADVTIYSPDPDLQRMFELPRYVIHAGEITVEEGDIRIVTDGKLLHVDPEFDEDQQPFIRDWFNTHYSIRFENYPVGEHYLRGRENVPCRPTSGR